MIKEFEKLNKEEASLIFKAPALVSVLVSCSYNEINKAQKGDAIKLAHLKTFTANPALLAYYNEVDKTFKEEFEQAAKKYFCLVWVPLSNAGFQPAPICSVLIAFSY